MGKNATSFVKGDRRAGRPKGRKSKFQRELNAKLRANGELTPLDVMLAMMVDETLDPAIRIRAAQGASPFVHRRKPQALEITGKFEFLSPEERELRRNLLLEEIRQRAAARSSIGSTADTN